MNKKEFLKLLSQDPEAVAAAMGLASELLTTSLADTLYEEIGLFPLVKIYGVMDFLWEIEMYDVAFDLIQALYGIADMKLPEVFSKLMEDEESACDFVDDFLEDFHDCLDDFCMAEYDCSLDDLQDGEMGG